jgi:chromate transport protein ChrA
MVVRNPHLDILNKRRRRTIITRAHGDQGPMAFLRSPLFSLWVLSSIPWLFAAVLYLGPRATRPGELIALLLLILIPPSLLSLGLAWTWKHFGEARWLGLPEHLRRGLLRLYLAITWPWVVWFSYRISEELQRHQYNPAWRYISGSVWSLLALPIGGPILLFAIFWIIAGFQRVPPDNDDAPPSSKTDSRSGAPDKSSEKRSSSSAATRSADHREIGRALAKLLMDPDDCWRHVCMLREHKAPGTVATCEMAFVRAAIVKDAICRCQPTDVAAEMLMGVDLHVAEAFVGKTDIMLRHYSNNRLSVIASRVIQKYEGHVFPLAELADAFAQRLSIPGVPSIEIAPLFEEVASEAERLMKLSFSVQKIGR